MERLRATLNDLPRSAWVALWVAICCGALLLLIESPRDKPAPAAVWRCVGVQGCDPFTHWSCDRVALFVAARASRADSCDTATVTFNSKGPLNYEPGRDYAFPVPCAGCVDCRHEPE
jgi:hypothetical protein